jgi:hypothetical protein
VVELEAEVAGPLAPAEQGCRQGNFQGAAGAGKPRNECRKMEVQPGEKTRGPQRVSKFEIRHDPGAVADNSAELKQQDFQR